MMTYLNRKVGQISLQMIRRLIIKAVIPVLGMFLVFLTSCSKSYDGDNWQLKGFVKVDSLNPILLPDSGTLFLDPIRGMDVKWEGKDIFNPTSLVRNDTLFMLYRAEDFVGKFNGTSRIGLAWSVDGLHFNREKLPIFYPQEDEMKYLEWEGGAEDPRIVESENGTYFMTYTAYDGNTARLLIASSPDLRTWTKHGSIFNNKKDFDKWSKSGSIVVSVKDGRMIATKVNGKYWMYFGDTNLFLATSSNLINWDPVEDVNGEWLSVLAPRKGKFDSRLVEPGPPAILTKEGILLIYNSMNLAEGGDPNLPEGTYTTGQALFDLNRPSELMERAEEYFFSPTKDYEITGQVNNVCFVEGLSFYKNRWFLYYGTADSKIAVAVSKGNIELK